MAQTANFSGQRVPDDLQPVLQRIADLFDRTVIVDGILLEKGGEQEWVNFHVFGMADASVADRLDKEKAKIFPPGEEGDYQILCSMDRSKYRGLWLQCLETQGEYCSGVHFC